MLLNHALPFVELWSLTGGERSESRECCLVWNLGSCCIAHTKKFILSAIIPRLLSQSACWARPQGSLLPSVAFLTIGKKTNKRMLGQWRRKGVRPKEGRRTGLKEQTGVSLKYSDKASSIPSSCLIFALLCFHSQKSLPPTDSPRSHHCEEEASLPTAHNTYKNSTNNCTQIIIIYCLFPQFSLARGLLLVVISPWIKRAINQWKTYTKFKSCVLIFGETTLLSTSGSQIVPL